MVADRDEARASERFETLLDRCERLRPEGLAFDELRELAQLYRHATAQLARLRDRGDDPEAVRAQNALCVRAFGHLAVAAPSRRGAHLAARIRRALGRTWRAQLAAWALLLVGVYVGAALVAREPRAAYALVPETLGYSAAALDDLLEDPDARLAFLAPHASSATDDFIFGSTLFANNTRVGLLTLATGVLAGVPSILLTVYNGVILGAFGAVFLRPPHAVEFLAWILPHGIPELTAIVLCSAAGLLLGAALVAPGRRGRQVALGEAAEAALLLLAGALPLLVAAAVIESFVRESQLPVGPRLGVAAGMLALLLVFLRTTRRAGRTEASWLRELSDPVHSGA